MSLESCADNGWCFRVYCVGNIIIPPAFPHWSSRFGTAYYSALYTDNACIFNAVSSSGGSFFPRRSALRNIPAHALADKEYFGCGVSSKICDKRDSTAALGYSPKLRVENSVGDGPSIPVPAVSQRPLSLCRQWNVGRVRLRDSDCLFEDGPEVVSLV